MERRKAEFETEHSDWAEREKLLSDGYGVIEGMVEGESFLLLLLSCRLLQGPASKLSVFFWTEFLPGRSVAICQAIEARVGFRVPQTLERFKLWGAHE